MHTQALTVYYDASCPMCAAEIRSLKNLDADGHMQLVDCSAPGFDDTLLRKTGLARADMMAALHVRDAAGRWHIGVDAFALLYRDAGLPAIALLWGHPLARPFTTRLYPWVARHRQGLGRLGLTWLLEQLGRLYALRAQRNSRRCAEGRCSIPD